jgi:hypothetical protein
MKRVKSAFEMRNVKCKMRYAIGDMRNATANCLLPTIYCLLLTLSLFPSCSKDDGNNNPPPVATERITGGRMYIGDSLNSSGLYNYTGNLLTEVLDYDAKGVQTGRAVMRYTGDRLDSMTSYGKWNGAMTRDHLVEFKDYAGNNPTVVIDHTFRVDGTETRQDKSTYVYEGTFLKKRTVDYFTEGTWKFDRCETYTYNNAGNIAVTRDSTAVWQYQTEMTYVNGLMTESVTRHYYTGSWTNGSKSVYTYSGSLLNKVSLYSWNGTGWDSSSQISFSYNANGHPAMQTWESQGFSYHIEFTYRTGTGNYRQFYNWAASPILPGDPMPVPVKCLKKRHFASQKFDY